MKKKVLSFDLTGTLATFRFCNSIYFEGLPGLYAQANGIDIETARGYLKESYDAVGEEASEWYDIKYWFDQFGLGKGWDRLLYDFSHNIRFYPEVPAVLSTLGQKYELIMITNACREFLEVEIATIRKYFSRIISCVSDFGEVKKTPEFYARVCHYLGREAHELIHVGDHWKFDFVAPSEYGATALYLDRTRQTSGELVIHDLTEIETKLI